ncbi:hypothetical protein BHE74_00018761 [Ensete ventricosum]|nr:hypothetical protein BHE74_00018761 [Ensete ventricosum]
MGEIEYHSSLIYLVKELCRSSKTLRGNLMEDNSCQVLTIGDQCQGLQFRPVPLGTSGTYRSIRLLLRGSLATGRFRKNRPSTVD